MTGLVLHPLRLRALDRMTVLRVPFREQPPDDSWFVGIDKRQEFAIFQVRATQYPVRLPYAPGEYFVKEGFNIVFDGWRDKVIYRADYAVSEARKMTPWIPAASMPEMYSRYLLTLGPPVPCRLGEVGMKEAIAEGWDGNIHCDYYDEWHMKTWNTLYPKHPYSPDRWTWGYPMEVRRR